MTKYTHLHTTQKHSLALLEDFREHMFSFFHRNTSNVEPLGIDLDLFSMSSCTNALKCLLAFTIDCNMFMVSALA